MTTQIKTDDPDIINQLHPLADQRTSLTILGIEFRSTGDVIMEHMPSNNKNTLTITLLKVYR